MTQVNIHEAKTHLSRLLKQVVRGEEIVIAKGNIPIARIIPISDGTVERKIGLSKGKVQISNDFDQALPDFEEYLN